MDINEARTAYNDAVARMNTAGDEAEAALGALPADATDEQIQAAEEPFRSAQEDVERRKANLARLEAIAAARDNNPVVELAEEPKEERRKQHATAKGQLRNELTYRPDQPSSFFRDLINHNRDRNAADRLWRNDEEQRDLYSQRDLAVSTDGQFIPPIYLGEKWAELPRAGRPFANVVPKMDLPADGLTVTVPKVSGGASEAPQNGQNAAVSETDATFTTVTASLVTIAGQQDIARQALERSFPGLDMVIYKDLAAAYDAKLDAQLLSGAGSSGEHAGLRSVSGVNTATASTATGISILSEIYNASQLVFSNRFKPANLVVMHPRRAAFLAQATVSGAPILQQGNLFQAFGTQDNTYAGSIAGLPVVIDPNIGTTYGNPGTNQDEIYVLHADDLLLMEGAVRQATFEDVGSGNLTVRLQLFGYSFWVPNRQAKSIAVISGAGLASPSFG